MARARAYARGVIRGWFKVENTYICQNDWMNIKNACHHT